MNSEEQLLQRRLHDLANRADSRNIPVFTEFLNLNELNIYHQTEKELSFVTCSTFGGYEHAERQIAAFIPDALSWFSYPIACIRIRPLQEKFADKNLTHRDYLGAVLNLGVERSVIGDILVDDAAAWMFCLDRMADFICRGLTRVKHTSVAADIVEPEKMDYSPKYEHIRGTVASVRLDALLSLAFGASRSSLIGLIEGKKVFVNARLVTSNGYKVKEKDVISVRGLGRFRYLGVSEQTRKGRFFAEIEKYV